MSKKKAQDLLGKASLLCEKALTEGFGPELNLIMIKEHIDKAVTILADMGEQESAHGQVEYKTDVKPAEGSPQKSFKEVSEIDKTAVEQQVIPPSGDMSIDKEIEKLSQDVEPGKESDSTEQPSFRPKEPPAEKEDEEEAGLKQETKKLPNEDKKAEETKGFQGLKGSSSIKSG